MLVHGLPQGEESQEAEFGNKKTKKYKNKCIVIVSVVESSHNRQAASAYVCDKTRGIQA